MSAKKKAAPGTLARNDKVRFDFDVLEKFEAGLVLTGQEVKSVKNGQMKLKGSHVIFMDNEAWLLNGHIPKYLKAGKIEGYDPERRRKLLLHRKEVDHLRGKSEMDGLTVAPIRVYMSRGRIKIEIAILKGRKKHEKREVLKKRDLDRETQQIMKLNRAS